MILITKNLKFNSTIIITFFCEQNILCLILPFPITLRFLIFFQNCITINCLKMTCQIHSQLKQTPIEEIDTLLNTFMIDPYNKIYEDDFNPYLSMNSNENIVYSKRKTGSYNKCIINEHYMDILVFAIKSYFKVPVVCYVVVSNVIWNAFIIQPNQIKWLFNGMPIIFRHLKEEKIILKFRKYSIDGTIIKDIDTENYSFRLYYSLTPLSYNLTMKNKIIIHKPYKIKKYLCFKNKGTIIIGNNYLESNILFHLKSNLISDYRIDMKRINKKCLLIKNELINIVYYSNIILKNYDSTLQTF